MTEILIRFKQQHPDILKPCVNYGIELNGIVHQKLKFCHHLFALISTFSFPEIVVERNIRLLRNTKDYILNNSLTVFVHIMKFSGIQHNTGLHYMIKKHEDILQNIYFVWSTEERKSYRLHRCIRFYSQWNRLGVVYMKPIMLLIPQNNCDNNQSYPVSALNFKL